MSRIENTCVLPARRFVQVAVLAALLAPLAASANEEVDALVNPNATEFSFGLAHVDDDNQRFGMYNGLDEGKGYVIGNIDLIRRNEETGTWIRLNARDIERSTAEASAEYERQGEWRIGLDYNQIPRVSPYEIHTNLQGIGSNSLAYPNNGVVNGLGAITTAATLQPASTARGINLETNRYRTKLEASRYFGQEVEFKVRFQNEEKHGQRLFGRGSSSQEFLAEPIDYQTRQLDATLNYTGERLQLSGGYYGSFFNNDNPLLNISGGAADFRNSLPVPNQPYNKISLPPDNSAHQFSLTGGYQFTASTRGTFKLAHTRAIQNDDFIDVGALNVSGRNDLGGRVDTTLVDLGLTAQPLPKLSLVGKLRYEDRDDKTSVAQYLNFTGLTVAQRSALSTDGFNEPRSLRTESGKLEATYQLPQGFSLTGGIDAERKERNVEGIRIVGYRAEVEEMTYRINLRRALSETLNGSLSYARSDRTGSDFRTLRTWNVVANPDTFGADYVLGGLLQPIYMADRDRNKVSLALDWMPTDALSFQFNAEDASDDYSAGRLSPADIGVREGDAWLLNLDATYLVNDNWRLTAWASRNVTNLDQATCRNKVSAARCAANSWDASLTTRSDAVGLGVRGKVLGKLNLGGDVTYLHDKNEYDQDGRGTAAAAAVDLPDIVSYTTTLKMFANYEIGKQSSVQLDYVLDHRKTNDWTWTDWRYTDGTVVEQDPVETVHFIGISYRYGFR